jgi:hypothetical protein
MLLADASEGAADADVDAGIDKGAPLLAKNGAAGAVAAVGVGGAVEMEQPEERKEGRPPSCDLVSLLRDFSNSS